MYLQYMSLKNGEVVRKTSDYCTEEEILTELKIVLNKTIGASVFVEQSNIMNQHITMYSKEFKITFGNQSSNVILNLDSVNEVVHFEFKVNRDGDYLVKEFDKKFYTCILIGYKINEIM